MRLINFLVINCWDLKSRNDTESSIPKFNVNMRIRGNTSRTKIVSPRTHINTCAWRMVNKAPSPSSLFPDFGSHGYLVDPLACVSFKMGKRHGALPRRDNNKGREVPGRTRRTRRFRGSTTRFRISAICSTAFRAHTACYLLYGYIGARSTGWCIVHDFHPRETLPSATRPCCGRRSCPASRCPVFGYGTGLLAHTVRKPIRAWAPSLFPLRCLFPSTCSDCFFPFSLTGSLEAH